MERNVEKKRGRGRARGYGRGLGRGRGRGGAETSEEHNLRSEIMSKRQATQRRVAALSYSAQKELLHMKRTVEISRLLLPDAPLRKHRKKQPSPEREPCCFVLGAGPSSAAEAEACSEPEAGPSSEPPVPEAGPSWEPEAGPSLEPDAGPSWKPEAGPSLEPDTLRQLLIQAPGGDVIIEFIDDDDAGYQPDDSAPRIGMELAAEMEIHSPPEILKRSTIVGIHDRTLEQTIDDSMQIESDDDSCFDDETDLDLPQTVCTASTEIASTTDYTDLERHILENEDAINDSALRSIAPDNAYDFTWHKEEAIFQGRQETFTGTPGPTIDMTDQTSILDVFYKMIDVEFIDMICTETNHYARQKIDLLQSQNKLTPNSRLLKWTPTDRDEMLTFLAVLILQGLYPLPEEELYFKFNGFGTMPYFRSIMTYNRFLLLKTMMHFAKSNNNTSKLWKIDPVTKYFNKKFSSLYYPSKEIVVDESLLKWHGRLSMVQKIATKAAKAGVKTYELCESSTGYLWKFIVYAGKDQETNRPTRTSTPTTDQQTDDTTDQTNEGPEDDASASDRLVDTGLLTDNSEIRPSNATALIVYQLVEPLLYRGHTLIMDNFYNSPLLARCLKRQKTDVYGTLRLNREFVPDSLKTLTKTDLQPNEAVVSYCSDLSVMVWRDSKLVGMISTYHLLRVGTANKHNRQTCKPNIVLDYNKSMGGVDRKDQFLSAHPMERSRNRVWYKKLFRRLYNAAVFNCFVIFATKNANISHRRFRTLLAENLLKAHRQLDLTTTTMPMHTYKRSGANRCTVEDDHFPMRTGSKKTRCWLCAQRKVDRRTIWKCIQCQVNLCIEDCFRAYHKPKAINTRHREPPR